MKRSQTGFSLIESMIALTVLAITMLGLVQLYGVAIRTNSLARYSTMSLSVAQQQLEQLQTEFGNELDTGTASPNLTAGTHGPITMTLAAPPGSGSGDRVFEVNWRVAENGDTKTVNVVVGPVNIDEFETKTLTMTTVFSP